MATYTIEELKPILETMTSRFTSLNPVPVERAVIVAKDWEIVKQLIEDAINNNGPECICPTCGLRHGGSNINAEF